MKKILTISLFMFFNCAPNSPLEKNLHAKQYWTEGSGKKSAKAVETNKLFVGLAEKMSPAVVTILSSSEIAQRQQQDIFSEDIFEFFFGLQNPGGRQRGQRRRPAPKKKKLQGLGSGFVIHKDGYVITNSHVVRINNSIADSVTVRFQGAPDSSRGVEADVIGIDATTDVAVLKLKKLPKNLTTIPLGDSEKAKVGEWVMAIGNPHTLSHSVTTGIISAKGRDILEEIQHADFIQTDASINQGNSGGPLINLHGEVVGINTAIDPRGQGLGFAIPINTAKNVISQLIEKGSVTRGYIGVQLFRGDFSSEVADSLGLKEAVGALIERVIPGEPAASAGLKAYDVVRKINSKRIDNVKDFTIAVGEAAPGSTVKIEFMRNGKRMKTELKLADRDEGFKRAQTQRSTPTRAQQNSRRIPRDLHKESGLELQSLTSSLKNQLGLQASATGLMIKNVEANSPAERSGLSRGDLIVEINKEAITNVQNAYKILSSAKKHLLKVQRGNNYFLFPLKL